MSTNDPIQSVAALKPSLMAEALQAMIQARQPAFIWGKPGVGKSQVMAQAAKALNRELRDVRAVLLDPVDLRGIPHVNGDGRAHWAVPDFLPREGEGVLFLDELNAAPPLVAAACYQLVLDGKLGEYTLPAGWSVMAAGNYETDRAVTTRMPTPLANRFVHLHFEIDLEDWCGWAFDNNVRLEVISFLRFRPVLMHNFDPKQASKAFASPRSWEFVSRILDSKPGRAVEPALIAGAVGEAASAEFNGFLRVFRNIPNPDAVLLHPDTAPVPEDPATLYALAGVLAQKATEANFDRVTTYAGRMPVEFAVLLVSDAAKRDKDIQNTAAFIKWASSNSDVLL